LNGLAKLFLISEEKTTTEEEKIEPIEGSSEATDTYFRKLYQDDEYPVEPKKSPKKPTKKNCQASQRRHSWLQEKH